MGGFISSIKKTAGVYEIVHRDSGRRYIGSSINVTYRLQRHRCDLRAQRGRSPALQNAWDKHGESAFDFRQVLVCRREDLIMYENTLIAAHRANIKPFGYNHRIAAETNAGALRIVCKLQPGMKFGRLTAVKHQDVVGTDRKWIFRCDCGVEKSLIGNSVRRGLTQSCGCWKRERDASQAPYRSGDKYNRLLLVAPTEQFRKERRLWECLCDCGASILAHPAGVRRGSPKSCGCRRTGPRIKNIIPTPIDRGQEDARI